MDIECLKVNYTDIQNLFWNSLQENKICKKN